MKPCPFCGGEASFGTIRLSSPSPITNKDGSKRNESFFANCQHCQANNNGIVHGYQTQTAAAIAWNTRAESAHPELEKRVAELEAENEEVRNRLHRLAYVILGGADDEVLREYARKDLDWL